MPATLALTPVSLLLAWLAFVVTMLVLDGLWLGVIARPLYQSGIGHLMAERPVWAAAAAFYAIYAAGVLYFVAVPEARAAVSPEGASLWTTAWRAALFGAVAYATYDFTNLATLRGWPWTLALADMAWGAVITGAAAVAARQVLIARAVA